MKQPFEEDRRFEDTISVVKWLLRSDDPSIRYLTKRDILGDDVDSKEMEGERRLLSRGPRIRTLLQGQRADGGFGVHPYQKWTGAHWRLVSLVELGIPPGHRKAVKATGLVLKWLLGDAHLGNVPKINGLYRRCASQEGNALAVCSRLGLDEDPRVRQLSESLVEWQWPDGGWNCDRREEAHHSSFNESLIPLWGQVEYANVTGDKKAEESAAKAAEFFLRHRLFRSCRSDSIRPIESFHGEMYRAIHKVTQLHYPLYWHTDILQELMILMRAGRLDDPRTNDALDLLEKKQGSDGKWHAEGYYWSLRRTPPNKAKMLASNVEIVDWGRAGPNEFITLNALRVLKTAGRA